MPHPDNKMCMRPTHIYQSPASQLVAAHESHDNDVLPDYREIINNTDKETTQLIENAYYSDEKKDGVEFWQLPGYEKIENEDCRISANKRNKNIANICAVLYGVIFLVGYFTYSSHTGCH